MNTPLDIAHAAMVADLEDAPARLKFFERLLDSELVLMLESEAEGETLSPKLFEVEGAQLALAFDRDDRLARFAGGAAYAALPGRVLVEMLAGAGLGLGVNLDVAPSAWVLPPEDVVDLARLSGVVPEEAQDRLDRIGPPEDLSERLVEALGEKLMKAVGMADAAYLVTATTEDGGAALMLGFVGTAFGADAALATAVGEALTFTGEDVALDVVHAPTDSPLAAALARQGVQLEIPAVPEPKRPDPDAPPKLR